MGQFINKCILPVGGRPAIHHVLETLADDLGCSKVTLLVGHLGDQVRLIAAEAGVDCELAFLDDSAVDGTYEALSHAIAHADTPFVYSHGNVALHATSRLIVKERFSRHTSGRSLAVVSRAPFAPTHPRFVVAEGGTVHEVIERAPRGGVTSVGLAIYEPSAFTRVGGARKFGAVEAFLSPDYLESGRLETLEIAEDWSHIESLDFYAGTW